MLRASLGWCCGYGRPGRAGGTAGGRKLAAGVLPAVVTPALLWVPAPAGGVLAGGPPGTEAGR